jgi:hypothetical protein
MPPQALAVLRWDAIAKAIFMGRGVAFKDYVKTPEEIAADQQQEQQAAMAQQAAGPVAGAVAGGITSQG